MNNGNLPASPQASVDKEYWEQFITGVLGGAPCGLTKREHFAAMAMQGLLSNRNVVVRGGTIDGQVKEMAVSYADGVLKALEADNEH